MKLDYSPFGMVMPGRNGNTPDYRYGFQGQEKDDEIKGEGNSINYKYRMHDPRIGRFFAVDPLTAKYPHYSPYSFSGNKVIQFVELEGLEEGQSMAGSSSGSISLNYYNTHIASGSSLTSNTSLSISPNSNYAFSGSYGGTTTKAPGADWKLDYYYRPYNKGTFENAMRFISNNTIGAVGNFGASIWNGGVNVVHGTAWTETKSMAGNVANFLNPLNWDYSLQGNVNALTQWETYDMPFQIALGGGAYRMMSTGTGSLLTSNTRIGLAPSSAYASPGSNIAFGLRDDLFNFANAKGFQTYRNFSSGIELPKLQNAITNGNNALHFNLTGFSKYQYSKFNPNGPITYGNLTNWELNTIYNTAGALNRTTFYRFVDGGYQIVPKPF